MVASSGSHLLATRLKVKTRAAQAFTIGELNGKPPVFLAGSSVADYEILWEQIPTQLDTEIKVWGIAGGSPFEWEQFQRQVPEAKTTFIVFSPVDLDEALISDFRAAIVPVGHTIRTLLAAHGDRNYSECGPGEYPITWLRVLSPTLGGLRGIMGDLRLKITTLISPSSPISESKARFAGFEVASGADS